VSKSICFCNSACLLNVSSSSELNSFPVLCFSFIVSSTPSSNFNSSSASFFCFVLIASSASFAASIVYSFLATASVAFDLC